ncbi:putative dehydrogenase [Opitutaceae bacterium TAV1]|nr:putative dehydrogenase [Opitutaceae bacterium TAV1]
MIRFCTIGCGGHASTAHGPAQKKASAARGDIELAACCDIDETRACGYRETFGFSRHYTDIGTMLSRESPDAVALVVPTTLTSRLAAPLLECGIPLFLEKPPGLTVAELDQLVIAGRRGGGAHQVAFNRRYAPVIAGVRGILDTTLPAEDVLQINYEMIRYDRRDPDFSTTAIHAIDAVRHLARSPYRRCSLSYRELPQLGTGVAAITIEGHCESGTQVRLNFQPVAGQVTETGTIHAVNHTLLFDVFGTEPGRRGSFTHWAHGAAKSATTLDGDPIDANGIYREFVAFLDAVKHHRIPSPVLADCRQQVTLMEAIRSRASTLTFPPSP